MDKKFFTPMAKSYRKVLKNNEKGFTLVEMLVTLLIVGLIAAVIVGVFSSPMKDASVTSSVAQIGDNMRAISDGADLYYVNKTAKITALTDLVSGTSPILKAIPAVPMVAKKTGFAGTFDYTYEGASATYKGWGDNAVNDVVLLLPGVTDEVCQGINYKYGVTTTATAAIPVAINAQKDLQCWNNGTDNVVIKVLYPN